MDMDSIFPEVGVIPTIVVVLTIAIVFQTSGLWVTMIIAGAFAALFTRSVLKSGIAGFLGVAGAWGIILVCLSITAQALDIANFFISLLGLTGLGWVVFIIIVLIGGMLGASGAIVLRSFIELIASINTREGIDNE